MRLLRKRISISSHPERQKATAPAFLSPAADDVVKTTSSSPTVPTDNGEDLLTSLPVDLLTGSPHGQQEKTCHTVHLRRGGGILWGRRKRRLGRDSHTQRKDEEEEEDGHCEPVQEDGSEGEEESTLNQIFLSLTSSSPQLSLHVSPEETSAAIRAACSSSSSSTIRLLGSLFQNRLYNPSIDGGSKLLTLLLLERFFLSDQQDLCISALLLSSVSSSSSSRRLSSSSSSSSSSAPGRDSLSASLSFLSDLSACLLLPLSSSSFPFTPSSSDYIPTSVSALVPFSSRLSPPTTPADTRRRRNGRGFSRSSFSFTSSSSSSRHDKKIHAAQTRALSHFRKDLPPPASHVILCGKGALRCLLAISSSLARNPEYTPYTILYRKELNEVFRQLRSLGIDIHDPVLHDAITSSFSLEELRFVLPLLPSSLFFSFLLPSQLREKAEKEEQEERVKKDTRNLSEKETVPAKTDLLLALTDDDEGEYHANGRCTGGGTGERRKEQEDIGKKRGSGVIREDGQEGKPPWSSLDVDLQRSVLLNSKADVLLPQEKISSLSSFTATCSEEDPRGSSASEDDGSADESTLILEESIHPPISMKTESGRRHSLRGEHHGKGDESHDKCPSFSLPSSFSSASSSSSSFHLQNRERRPLPHCHSSFPGNRTPIYLSNDMREQERREDRHDTTLLNDLSKPGSRLSSSSTSPSCSTYSYLLSGGTIDEAAASMADSRWPSRTVVTEPLTCAVRQQRTGSESDLMLSSSSSRGEGGGDRGGRGGRGERDVGGKSVGFPQQNGVGGGGGRGNKNKGSNQEGIAKDDSFLQHQMMENPCPSERSDEEKTLEERLSAALSSSEFLVEMLRQEESRLRGSDGGGGIRSKSTLDECMSMLAGCASVCKKKQSLLQVDAARAVDEGRMDDFATISKVLDQVSMSLDYFRDTQQRMDTYRYDLEEKERQENAYRPSSSSSSSSSSSPLPPSSSPSPLPPLVSYSSRLRTDLSTVGEQGGGLGLTKDSNEGRKKSSFSSSKSLSQGGDPPHGDRRWHASVVATEREGRRKEKSQEEALAQNTKKLTSSSSLRTSSGTSATRSAFSFMGRRKGGGSSSVPTPAPPPHEVPSLNPPFPSSPSFSPPPTYPSPPSLPPPFPVSSSTHAEESFAAFSSSSSSSASPSPSSTSMPANPVNPLLAPPPLRNTSFPPSSSSSPLLDDDTMKEKSSQAASVPRPSASSTVSEGGGRNGEEEGYLGGRLRQDGGDETGVLSHSHSSKEKKKEQKKSSSKGHDHHPLDRQPSAEPTRTRQNERTSQEDQQGREGEGGEQGNSHLPLSSASSFSGGGTSGGGRGSSTTTSVTTTTVTPHQAASQIHTKSRRSAGGLLTFHRRKKDKQQQQQQRPIEEDKSSSSSSSATGAPPIQFSPLLDWPDATSAAVPDEGGVEGGRREERHSKDVSLPSAAEGMPSSSSSFLSKTKKKEDGEEEGEEEEAGRPGLGERREKKKERGETTRGGRGHGGIGGRKGEEGSRDEDVDFFADYEDSSFLIVGGREEEGDKKVLFDDGGYVYAGEEEGEEEEDVSTLSPKTGKASLSQEKSKKKKKKYSPYIRGEGETKKKSKKKKKKDLFDDENEEDEDLFPPASHDMDWRETSSDLLSADPFNWDFPVPTHRTNKGDEDVSFGRDEEEVLVSRPGHPSFTSSREKKEKERQRGRGERERKERDQGERDLSLLSVYEVHEETERRRREEEEQRDREDDDLDRRGREKTRENDLLLLRREEAEDRKNEIERGEREDDEEALIVRHYHHRDLLIHPPPLTREQISPLSPSSALDRKENRSEEQRHQQQQEVDQRTSSELILSSSHWGVHTSHPSSKKEDQSLQHHRQDLLSPHSSSPSFEGEDRSVSKTQGMSPGGATSLAPGWSEVAGHEKNETGVFFSPDGGTRRQGGDNDKEKRIENSSQDRRSKRHEEEEAFRQSPREKHDDRLHTYTSVQDTASSAGDGVDTFLMSSREEDERLRRNRRTRREEVNEKSIHSEEGDRRPPGDVWKDRRGRGDREREQGDVLAPTATTTVTSSPQQDNDRDLNEEEVARRRTRRRENGREDDEMEIRRHKNTSSSGCGSGEGDDWFRAASYPVLPSQPSTPCRSSGDNRSGEASGEGGSRHGQQVPDISPKGGGDEGGSRDRLSSHAHAIASHKGRERTSRKNSPVSPLSPTSSSSILQERSRETQQQEREDKPRFGRGDLLCSFYPDGKNKPSSSSSVKTKGRLRQHLSSSSSSLDPQSLSSTRVDENLQSLTAPACGQQDEEEDEVVVVEMSQSAGDRYRHERSPLREGERKGREQEEERRGRDGKGDLHGKAGGGVGRNRSRTKNHKSLIPCLSSSAFEDFTFFTTACSDQENPLQEDEEEDEERQDEKKKKKQKAHEGGRSSSVSSKTSTITHQDPTQKIQSYTDRPSTTTTTTTTITSTPQGSSQPLKSSLRRSDGGLTSPSSHHKKSSSSSSSYEEADHFVDVTPFIFKKREGEVENRDSRGDPKKTRMKKSGDDGGFLLLRNGETLAVSGDDLSSSSSSETQKRRNDRGGKKDQFIQIKDEEDNLGLGPAAGRGREGDRFLEEKLKFLEEKAELLQERHEEQKADFERQRKEFECERESLKETLERRSRDWAEKCREYEKREEEQVSQVRDLSGRVIELEEDLRKKNEETSRLRFNLQEKVKALDNAKDMWMKESARASALSDRLNEAEDSIAELQEKFSSLSSKYGDVVKELESYRILINRQGSSPTIFMPASSSSSSSSSNPLAPSKRPSSSSSNSTASVQHVNSSSSSSFFSSKSPSSHPLHSSIIPTTTATTSNTPTPTTTSTPMPSSQHHLLLPSSSSFSGHRGNVQTKGERDSMRNSPFFPTPTDPLHARGVHTPSPEGGESEKDLTQQSHHPKNSHKKDKQVGVSSSSSSSSGFHLTTTVPVEGSRKHTSKGGSRETSTRLVSDGFSHRHKTNDEDLHLPSPFASEDQLWKGPKTTEREEVEEGEGEEEQEGRMLSLRKAELAEVSQVYNGFNGDNMMADGFSSSSPPPAPPVLLPPSSPYSSSSSYSPLPSPVIMMEEPNQKSSRNLPSSSSVLANSSLLPQLPPPSSSSSSPFYPSGLVFREETRDKRDSLNVKKLGGGRKTPSSRIVLVSDYLRQLLLTDDALLYEDDTLQIGVKSVFEGLEGRVCLYYGNKTSGLLQNITGLFHNPQPDALVLRPSILPSLFSAKQQVCQDLALECRAPFNEWPSLRLHFLMADNTPRQICVTLPIFVSKFMEGRLLKADEFFLYWKNEKFVLKETSCVLNLHPRFRGSLLSVARAAQLGKALSLCAKVDPNPENLVLAGAYPSSVPTAAAVPVSIVLVRLEIGRGRYHGKCRLVVRSDCNVLSCAIRDLINLQLAIPESANTETTEHLLSRPSLSYKDI
ncbi:adaptin c-terminal domain-containing protein [Cystoisospora suis]|uniref:Adaptin c-terminal domain-containing protein n=1 Tax=Cystoisospora suis TaxID=483139 RepID=A0A2C6KKZ8_9APIC|nr:adaptin c-terminal domain-containing protein [Cystoisospora suis]